MKPAQRLSILDFRPMLAEMINRVRYAGERFVVTRRGEEFAAFVSMEDLKVLEALEKDGQIKRKKSTL